MIRPYSFTYHFFPVGQGLFSMGGIFRPDQNFYPLKLFPDPKFIWVYDCGSLSSTKLIDKGITELKSQTASTKRIDLLVLSHFDEDHINGVCRLVQEFEIRILMLPYMPLAQRLVLAFEERSGSIDNKQIDFYINPVAFFLNQGGPGIGQILFVPPSDGEGPPIPTDVKPITEDERKSDDPNITIVEDSELLELEQEEIALLITGAKDTKVKFLKKGLNVISRSFAWEFVPYNDDPKLNIADTFSKTVSEERNALISNVTRNKHKALKKLKTTYDSQFGCDSEDRNVISLFLYSGPIYSSWRKCSLIHAKRSCDLTNYWHVCDWNCYCVGSYLRDRSSILYTGDGYLNDANQLNKLVRYLSAQRVTCAGVFQVMHHGAVSNWHQGVAATINPIFSIFSSDPGRKRWQHPDAAVLRDFWVHGAVQVDKDFAFTACGRLLPKNT